MRPGEPLMGSDSWLRLSGDQASTSDTLAYVLGGLYLALAVVALVQLVRIQVRLPEYGWTTQKVFHLLNVVCLSARAALFYAFHSEWMVNDASPPSRPLFYFFSFTFPGEVYFTTYTLLILFWAEIYHQARSLPLKHLRPSFFAINAAVYLAPLSVAVAQHLTSGSAKARMALKYAFAACMCFNWALAALGFAFYGGKLFTMLRRFPLESKGRRKKLQEVGTVAGISATTFSLRAALSLGIAFLSYGPYVKFAYYVVVEVVPVAVVLFVLRKLPPRRQADGYHAIR